MLGEYVFDLNSLYSHFEELTDQRKRRGICYPLANALTLITLAKLGGEDGPTGTAKWLDHRAETLVTALALARETMLDRVTISLIPGHAVQIEELEQVLQHYFDGQAQLSQAVVTAGGDYLWIANQQRHAQRLSGVALPGASLQVGTAFH
jgi:hypothetical protein